ncbi:hypothetical protein TREMEDRAFT_59829 [Tremella mesenterica DSM 1558]|uniref:uncharacterized protein n=1 Tax=Tremella mesenterica (strain ATCC 24925 / CBS 8224 / DSM 1558 / NBRC 9311 / NRRL Y-6157 / RJB 2259-6 / UBC 559-6) TaxID=578456 RepID=UPI0003F49B3B|nr:uncharacterized protein TREMEDRAFT_59829 [Tremella mesenterica DSM 1558]EIW73656.1 hypothetical protein TREMEDRAFT_59829 [Tremella mesenterica DSM 1558]
MSTKTRRPVMMSTPPPKSKKTYGEAEKRSLLENFDLEVADKTRAFRSHLQATLSSFLIRQETEIFKIPRELRNMTLGELSTKWAGGWASTTQRIAREKIEEAEREREREEAAQKAEREGAKRKRGTVGTPDATPERKVKSRKDQGQVAGKRKPGKTKKPSAPSTHSSQGPSSLPQDHIFNPSLPPTPRLPRLPKRNESLLSINGSPLANPISPSTSLSTSESGLDLPDPAEMERKALSKSQANRSPKSKSSKKKRAPSLIFRPSLAVPSRDTNDTNKDGAEVRLAHIGLSDGRTLRGFGGGRES